MRKNPSCATGSFGSNRLSPVPSRGSGRRRCSTATARWRRRPAPPPPCPGCRRHRGVGGGGGRRHRRAGSAGVLRGRVRVAPVRTASGVGRGWRVPVPPAAAAAAPLEGVNVTEGMGWVPKDGRRCFQGRPGGSSLQKASLTVMVWAEPTAGRTTGAPPPHLSPKREAGETDL